MRSKRDFRSLLPDNKKKGFGKSKSQARGLTHFPADWSAAQRLAWCNFYGGVWHAVATLPFGSQNEVFRLILPADLYDDHDVLESVMSFELHWRPNRTQGAPTIPGPVLTNKITAVFERTPTLVAALGHKANFGLMNMAEWLRARLHDLQKMCISAGYRDAARRLASMVLEGTPDNKRVVRFSRAGNAALQTSRGERLVLVLPLSPDGSLPDAAAALGWLDAAKRAGRAGGAASLLVLGVASQQDVALHPAAESVTSDCLSSLLERHAASEATRTARAEAARAAASAVIAAARTRDVAALEAASLTHYGDIRAAADGAAALAACWRAEDATASALRAVDAIDAARGAEEASSAAEAAMAVVAALPRAPSRLRRAMAAATASASVAASCAEAESDDAARMGAADLWAAVSRWAAALRAVNAAPSSFSLSFASAFSSSPVAVRLSSAIDAATEELRSLDAVVSMFAASDAAPLDAPLGTAALSLASSLPARAFAAVAEIAAATEARLVSAAAKAAALERVRAAASSDEGMDSPLFDAAEKQAVAAGVSTRDIYAAAADAIGEAASGAAAAAASRAASATAANNALLPRPTLPGNWEQAGPQLWFDRDSLLGVGSNSTVVYAGVFARKCRKGYEPVPAAVKRVSITPDVADATAQRIKRDADIGDLLSEKTRGLVVRPLCVYLDGNDFLVSAAEVRKRLETPPRLPPPPNLSPPQQFPCTDAPSRSAAADRCSARCPSTRTARLLHRGWSPSPPSCATAPARALPRCAACSPPSSRCTRCALPIR